MATPSCCGIYSIYSVRKDQVSFDEKKFLFIPVLFQSDTIQSLPRTPLAFSVLFLAIITINAFVGLLRDSMLYTPKKWIKSVSDLAESDRVIYLIIPTATSTAIERMAKESPEWAAILERSIKMYYSEYTDFERNFARDDSWPYVVMSGRGVLLHNYNKLLQVADSRHTGTRDAAFADELLDPIKQVHLINRRHPLAEKIAKMYYKESFFKIAINVFFLHFVEPQR